MWTWANLNLSRILSESKAEWHFSFIYFWVLTEDYVGSRNIFKYNFTQDTETWNFFAIFSLLIFHLNDDDSNIMFRSIRYLENIIAFDTCEWWMYFKAELCVVVPGGRACCTRPTAAGPARRPGTGCNSPFPTETVNMDGIDRTFGF